MTPVVKFPVPAMSVVVPTHGRTELFAETLASLERQTLASFEVIVTDDSALAEDRQTIETATRGYPSGCNTSWFHRGMSRLRST